MLTLRKTKFLKGEELVYFINIIIYKAASSREASEMLQSQLLGKRAKLMNDDVWIELYSVFVKFGSAWQNEEKTYEKVLNGPFTKIIELSDIRIGSGGSSNIMPETIANLRDIEVFTLICRKPPDNCRS